MKNVLKKLAFALSVLSILAALTACSVSGGEQEDVNSAVTESSENLELQDSTFYTDTAISVKDDSTTETTTTTEQTESTTEKAFEVKETTDLSDEISENGSYFKVAEEVDGGVVIKLRRTEKGTEYGSEENPIPHIVIPSEFNGKKVIGISWGFDFQYFSKITISDGIQEIYDNAFTSCYTKEIVMPDSINKIGSGVFAYTDISEIIIPESVTEIGEYAFSDCQNLTSITIPSKITEIKEGTFYNCTLLKSVTLPNSLKKIGSCAFYGSALTGLTLPDSVEEIEEDAFEGLKIDITYKGEVYSSTRYRELYAVINNQ